MEYTVVLTPAEEGGFIVEVPAFPEIVTQGDTLAESLDNAREAIELAVAVYKERGRLIPEDPQVKLSKVEITSTR